MKKISIFGGAQPKPGSPVYEDAYRLGYMLASSGYTIATGGYIGTMEAASRGAADAAGHVIGVTCGEIETFRPGNPNQWVIEEIRCTTLRERIFNLIQLCDAAMALPGGPGTLTEVSMMWNHLLIKAITPKPLILIGPDWQETMSLFIRRFGEYIPDGETRWIQYAPDVESAVEQLNSFFKLNSRD